MDVGQLEPVTPVDVASQGHRFMEDNGGPLHNQGTSGLEQGVESGVVGADVELAVVTWRGRWVQRNVK